MKYLKYISSILPVILILSMITSCGEDEVTASLQELRNEGFDLAVVNDANKYVNISFTVKGSGLKSVTATATLDGDTEPTGTATLDKINSNSLNRINMKIPFPASNLAPSGLYVISYSYVTSDGTKDGGSYSINVINNIPPAYCDYSDPLPEGKNLLIKLYVPTADQMPADDNTIYATGSFEGWTGGAEGGDYIFTQISPTCYILAVDMPADAAFKITRGDWPKEAQGYNKSNFSDRIYNGTDKVIEIAIYDWADTDFDLSGIDPPSAGLEIPSAAVVSGKMTIVANVTNYDVNDGDYYVVEEGATSLTDAIKMTPFESINSLAAAVPKQEGINYVIVKDEASAEGTNAYGFAPEIMWDGETNPVQVPIGSFGDPYVLPENLYMTGSATDSWAGGGDYPIAKIADGIYQATYTINGDSEYLLLPSPGGWDFKWAYGGTGDSSSGTLSSPGSGNNLSTSGLSTGSYQITVDFTVGTGTYTLTPAN